MIRYIAFCKIVETGSFTKAATALGYTQAAVSQMVRSLESEYELTLLVRNRTGVTLTKEGERLYPLIRKYVGAYREISDKVGEINGLQNGEIRIGTFSSMSQHLLPGLMNDFGSLYPGINFVLHQGDNTTLPEWIRTDMIDIGFVYPEASAGLALKLFARDEFLAVFPEGHPLSCRSSVSLSDMAKEPLIIVDEGGVNTVLSAFADAGLSPRIKYRIHDDYTILSMVEKGIGVSILPSMILDRANYRLKTVPMETPVNRTVGVCYQNFATLNVASRKFLNFMMEHLDKYLPEQNVVKDTDEKGKYTW